MMTDILIDNDATPKQVMSMARHKDYNTTLRYFHESSRLKAPAGDLIDYGEVTPRITITERLGIGE